jgi:hypothetical protein
MIGVEIWIDGEKKAVAPITGMQLMIAGIHAGQRLRFEPRAGDPKQLERYLELNVGGLTADEHQNWVSMLPLRTGSEVRFAIVDVEVTDAPIERSPRSDPE